MTRSSDVSSIDCTSCGAGLNILGGGRVKVHVCPYCGSALDTLHDYKVLRKYTDMRRPHSPFRIGMTGEIEGVEFTVIGTLGYEEHWQGRVWRWTDHQVFSPTHGYAYLTVEEDHFTFTRRHRGGLSPHWISAYAVEGAEERPSIWSGEECYDYYETVTSTLAFIEGEFNWQPELGGMRTSVSFMSDDAMLSLSASNDEREVDRTTYLAHAETCEAFGITDANTHFATHPLQPYVLGATGAFVKRASIGFTIVCALLSCVLLFQSAGTRVTQEKFALNELPVEIPLSITTPNRLTRVKLSADVDNSWAYIGTILYDPDDAPVFEAGRTVEKYSGRDNDGRWTEGSGSGRFYFRPEIAGVYTLELSLEESDTWQREGTALRSVEIEVHEGVASKIWMFCLTLVFGALAAYYIRRPTAHLRRRWAGSDWTDED